MSGWVVAANGIIGGDHECGGQDIQRRLEWWKQTYLVHNPSLVVAAIQEASGGQKEKPLLKVWANLWLCLCDSETALPRQ